MTPPMEKPVIEDHSGLLGTFATVAERRMVITKKKYDPKYTHAEDPGYVSLFCAEPPPDSTQSIASSLTAALKADASQDKNKQEVSADMAKQLITTARVIFTRSQGVQLFRDGVYNLCQAHLNEAITADEYSDNFKNLLDVSAKLIAAEIEKGPNPDVAKVIAAADAEAKVKEAAAEAKIEKQDAAVEAKRKLAADAKAKEATATPAKEPATADPAPKTDAK